jgi:hypothetical protein
MEAVRMCSKWVNLKAGVLPKAYSNAKKQSLIKQALQRDYID